MKGDVIAAARRTVLDETHSLMQRAREMAWKVEPDVAAQSTIAERLQVLQGRYVALVPTVELARCPLCGEVFEHSLDVQGIDGLWWSCDDPIRPPTGVPCDHFVGLSGALRLAPEAIDPNEMLVKPGPDVPFVIPRLLVADDAFAVLSTRAIGPHTGYPVAYFAGSPPDARVNTWGAEDYEYLDDQASLVSDSVLDDESDYDFELAPWLESGKLKWIVPGDDTLTLRSGVEGCPYVNVDGRRRIMHVRRGRVWADASELDD